MAETAAEVPTVQVLRNAAKANIQKSQENRDLTEIRITHRIVPDVTKAEAEIVLHPADHNHRIREEDGEKMAVPTGDSAAIVLNQTAPVPLNPEPQENTKAALIEKEEAKAVPKDDLAVIVHLMVEDQEVPTQAVPENTKDLRTETDGAKAALSDGSVATDLHLAALGVHPQTEEAVKAVQNVGSAVIALHRAGLAVVPHRTEEGAAKAAQADDPVAVVHTEQNPVRVPAAIVVEMTKNQDILKNNSKENFS